MFNENDYPPVSEALSDDIGNFIVSSSQERCLLGIDLEETEMQEVREAGDVEVAGSIAVDVK